MIWILLGCLSESPSPERPHVIDPERLARVGAQLPACTAYSQDEAVFSFCVARGAHQLPDTSVCSDAGNQEGACHLDWVSARLRSPKVSAETLLQGCGPAQDCALMVLDAHPRADLAAHAQACSEHTGRFVNDCINHAGRRWIVSLPSPQQQAELNATPSPRPDLVGFWIGVTQACQHQPMACELAPEGASAVSANRGPCEAGFAQAAARESQWCAIRVQ